MSKTGLSRAGLLDVDDQVRSVLLLLESSIHHLGAGDVPGQQLNRKKRMFQILLGVGEVDVHGLLRPRDFFLDVGGGVGVALGTTCLPLGCGY